MSLDIRVFGEHELLDLVERGEALPDHLVSIGNPRFPLKPAEDGQRLQPRFRSAFRRILRLSFYDVETPSQLGPWRPLVPRRVPELRDARRVLRFFETTRAEASGYALHCWAGISRSTAVALALLYRLTDSEREAGRVLRRIRPEGMPNLRLASLFDRLLGSSLHEEAARIHRDRLASMSEEIDRMLDGLVEEFPAASEGELDA